jgi:hypothetical protein
MSAGRFHGDSHATVIDTTLAICPLSRPHACHPPGGHAITHEGPRCELHQSWAFFPAAVVGSPEGVAHGLMVQQATSGGKPLRCASIAIDARAYDAGMTESEPRRAWIAREPDGVGFWGYVEGQDSQLIEHGPGALTLDEVLEWGRGAAELVRVQYAFNSDSAFSAGAKPWAGLPSWPPDQETREAWDADVAQKLAAASTDDGRPPYGRHRAVDRQGSTRGLGRVEAPLHERPSRPTCQDSNHALRGSGRSAARPRARA